MARTHKLTAPIRISFLVKAGEQPPLRVREGMTKHIKVSFLTKRKVKMRDKPQLIPLDKTTKIYASPGGEHYHLDKTCPMLQGGQFERYRYREITPSAVKRRKLRPCTCTYKREAINLGEEMAIVMSKCYSQKLSACSKHPIFQPQKAINLILALIKKAGWKSPEEWRTSIIWTPEIEALVEEAGYVKLTPQQLKILETCSGHHL